ncbi:DUF4833 domain-containing protein [Segetibacter aerophilus]|uniref:DUF4833 domain-containing protein n=1 Tax=Segetibacter aerophilus TaxID=670293 RepID=A0A512BEJ3_9BACT|nr:DUF4833 domain-containing protein [Segetibacter aerophilus]GEO10386.1 hypothetical protein SAE01_28820 [Segetibacter aerophilus]
MNRVIYKRGAILFFLGWFTTLAVIAQDKFPVPVVGPNQLFYLQRTANTNTIICELNYNNNVLDMEEPVHVYWIRYTDKGQKEELNFVQKKFAYGIKSTPISKDKYELNFVSYKKFPMLLMKGANNKYNVYGTINQKQAIINRIFVKINGGSFWSPNVEYVEIKGVDPSSGKEVIERRKI